MGVYVVTGGSTAPARERTPRRAGVTWDGGRLTLPSLGQTVTVTVPDFAVSPELDMWHALTLLHYLDLADGTPLLGKMMAFAQYPDGIDGLCCNAGVSGACGNLKLMISLNYFGATNLAHGLFDLLKKKGGSCVVTSSNTISQGAARMDLVDMLNYSQTKPVNEERILNIIEKFDESSLAVGNSIYVTTKYALARWARRVSASWAANGVRINTVAPGNVSTPMTATMSENAKAALAALPIPINYGTDTLMDPEDIANVIAFLVSPLAHGINGNVLFVDGGTDALLNSEKVY